MRGHAGRAARQKGWEAYNWKDKGEAEETAKLDQS